MNTDSYPMYTTIIPKKIFHMSAYVTLIPGVRYVFSKNMLKKIEEDPKTANRFKVDDEFFQTNFKNFNTHHVCSYKKITVFRAGGIGDLLFSYPVLSKIKQINPECKIRYITNRRNFDFLNSFSGDFIHDIASLPLTKREFQDADAHIDFEGLIESHGNAEVLDAYDLFYKFVFPNESIPNELLPHFSVHQPIYDELKRSMPGNLIIMHLRSSSLFRNVRKDICLDTIRGLASAGYNIGIIDAIEHATSLDKFIEINLQDCRNRVYNLAHFASTLRHTIEICRIADFAIGVDSSVINIFATMDKPCIGLYTCFPGKLRLSHFPKAVILQSSYTDCGIAPCFHHLDGVPKCVDVRNGKVAGCISGIKSDEIIDKAKSIFTYNTNAS